MPKAIILIGKVEFHACMETKARRHAAPSFQSYLKTDGVGNKKGKLDNVEFYF